MKIRILILLILFAQYVHAQKIDKEKVADYFQNQQFEDAISYLLPFYSNDSNSLQLLNYLGYANYMNDDKFTAKKYFQKILFIDTANISANQYLANIWMGSNNYDSAKVFMLRLVKYYPSKSSYYRVLGTIYNKLKINDSAFFYFEHAYRLAPTDFKNIVAFSDYLIGDSSYIQADSVLQTALKDNPSNLTFLRLQVRSFFETKNYPGIIEPGERLISTNDLSTVVLSELAIAYYNLNRYADCIRICEYMQLNGLAKESTYYYESKAYQKLNHLEESIKYLKICLSYSISETSELYLVTLAQNLEWLKNYREEIANYDKAYFLFKNPVMLYYIANVYDVFLHNYAKAKIYYTRYLSLAHSADESDRITYKYAKKRVSSMK